MITAFFTVLGTRNLEQQCNFYANILGLEPEFENNDTVGFGQNGQLYIVIRRETTAKSHHGAENKDPIILTFKCEGNPNALITKLAEQGCNVHEQYQELYYFIKDYDGNEICLDFS